MIKLLKLHSELRSFPQERRESTAAVFPSVLEDFSLVTQGPPSILKIEEFPFLRCWSPRKPFHYGRIVIYCIACVILLLLPCTVAVCSCAVLACTHSAGEQ